MAAHQYMVAVLVWYVSLWDHYDGVVCQSMGIIVVPYVSLWGLLWCGVSVYGDYYGVVCQSVGTLSL